MFTDIVFPKNNEAEFLRIAKKLDIKLCFAYSQKEFNEKKEKFECCCLYNSQNRNFFVISDKISRQNFENLNINLMFNLEKSQGHDFMHQRESRFNHILARICRETKKTIGFNFNLVLNSDKKERPKLLGRMLQNVKLCRKYKVNMFVGSFASEPFELRTFYELRSFAASIGMNPGEMTVLF